MLTAMLTEYERPAADVSVGEIAIATAMTEVILGDSTHPELMRMSPTVRAVERVVRDAGQSDSHRRRCELAL